MVTDKEKEMIDYIFDQTIADKNKSHDRWFFYTNEAANKYNIPVDELGKLINNFFIEISGVSVYSKCPECGGFLCPKKSIHGYWIGCEGYPKCNFKIDCSKNVI